MRYLSSHCMREREQLFGELVRFALKHGFERPVSMGRCHGVYPETSNQTDLHWGPTRVPAYADRSSYRIEPLWQAP